MARSRTRVVLGIFGLDQHDFGAKVVSAILRDAGMEVVYLGSFQTAETIVQAAIEEDADVIGMSCHSWEYLGYTRELISLLREKKLDIAVVIGGGTISEADESSLRAMGVSDVLTPGATAEEIVHSIQRVAARPAS